MSIDKDANIGLESRGSEEDIDLVSIAKDVSIGLESSDR